LQLALTFQVQGAIIVASLLQVIIGATGTMGFLMKYIGPLTITPVITLTGLSLFDIAANHACKFVNWKTLPPHQNFFSNWFIPFAFFDSNTLGNCNFVSFRFRTFYSTFSPFRFYFIPQTEFPSTI
jgi:hypothetical protein